MFHNGCGLGLFYYQYLVVSSYADAFELVERIDDVVYGSLLVPCKVESNVFRGLLLIDGLHLVERCNIIQDGCQFDIFVDDGLV